MVIGTRSCRYCSASVSALLLIASLFIYLIIYLFIYLFIYLLTNLLNDNRNFWAIMVQ